MRLSKHEKHFFRSLLDSEPQAREASMLIDAHAHLDRYGDALESALREIRQQRIFTIGTSMDLASYERLPTFGVHPKNAPQYAGHLGELSDAIEQSPAIGEIGLDFHWVKDSAQYPDQVKVLEYFLAAAGEQNKIVNLHTKGAEKEILDLLERYGTRRAIVHWYSGPLDLFRALVDYGAYFTVGVEVIFSAHIRTLAQKLPEAQLLTETDNPGGLKWLNGEIGMPQALAEVVHTIAGLRGSEPDAIRETVEANFLRLTENDPWLEPFRDRLQRG
ncbi:MAG: TatD family hydrolase [Deltaproteobacteria bacterium]|nr:TatD family hydrolase [Deltaproteobacteria bacterium]